MSSFPILRLLPASRQTILSSRQTITSSRQTIPSSRQMSSMVRIQRPDRAGWYRQQLLAVSKPKWTPKHETTEGLWEDCEFAAMEEEKVAFKNDSNQLDKLYARQMMELFHKSKMVAFFHTNPISDHKFRTSWQDGRRIGAELKRYSKRIGQHGLQGTQWENCLNFFMNYDVGYKDYLEQPMLFFPEVNPNALIKYEKKVLEFHLLGAVVENRILSRAEIIALVDMPTLDHLRAELSAILQSPAREVTRLLGANQQQLSTNLQQYFEDGEKK